MNCRHQNYRDILCNSIETSLSKISVMIQIFCLLNILSLSLQAQVKNYVFEYISMDQGLSQSPILTIAQDEKTGKVVMFAWMNRESLALTLEKGEAVYFSRSRQKLWHKGEESGHTQAVLEIRFDCDEDVILLKVEQKGGIACHTGRESCFYRRLEGYRWVEVDGIIKDPGDIYR